MSQSESTIIYHISQAIKMGHPVGKEILKMIRSGTQIPEIIFGHFTLYLVRNNKIKSILKKKYIYFCKVQISSQISIISFACYLLDANLFYLYAESEIGNTNTEIVLH